MNTVLFYGCVPRKPDKMFSVIRKSLRTTEIDDRLFLEKTKPRIKKKKSYFIKS